MTMTIPAEATDEQFLDAIEMALKITDELRMSGDTAKRAIAMMRRGLSVAHPTGSERFAEALEELGAPVPWRLCDEEVGEVLAVDGGVALTVDTRVTDEECSALALWIVLAVNTLAGLKAEIPAA